MHIQSRKLVVRDIAHCCFATVAGAAKRFAEMGLDQIESMAGLFGFRTRRVGIPDEAPGNSRGEILARAFFAASDTSK